MQHLFDGIGANRALLWKHLGRQPCLAHRRADARHQAFQRRMLARRQAEHGIGQPEGAVVAVIPQRSTFHLRLCPALAAPVQRSKPRFQLGQFKGFGQIIIRTTVQAFHAVLHCPLCGQHQHRYTVATGAHGRQPVKAVLVWQLQIQHHHIEAAILQQCGG
ncbi:hypothetical protein D3C72_1433900 [compost metagenome]